MTEKVKNTAFIATPVPNSNCDLLRSELWLVQWIAFKVWSSNFKLAIYFLLSRSIYGSNIKLPTNVLMACYGIADAHIKKHS